ncbi:MAG: hypothetical protein ACFCUQ_11870 [Kiloniellales bacterium]
MRAAHVAALAATRPPVGFLEVHAENYTAGGAAPARSPRLQSVGLAKISENVYSSVTLP